MYSQFKGQTVCSAHLTNINRKRSITYIYLYSPPSYVATSVFTSYIFMRHLVTRKDRSSSDNDRLFLKCDHIVFT